MAPESVRALLASLTGSPGESAESVYYHWAFGTTNDPGPAGLEELVRRKVYTNGIGTGTVAAPQFPAKVAASRKESLLEILHSNGAVGESVQACLLKSGLTGWS